MVSVVDLEEVGRLLRQEEAQLVEVLPHAEYEDEHLPGAISLPLRELTRAQAAWLDTGHPVIFYCYDWQ